MIAIINRLPVKEGAADRVVERFAGSGGHVHGFPGFVSMEVLRSDEEVLVITRWRDRKAFDAWVGSEEFRQAHGRGGGGDLLSGRPQMGSYDVAVERAPETP